ncbi:hypothetical protein [Actinokineospora sp. HUAS TT18]|uniref:hypothetical protein n=1 Tax=Actinokineospora sp. HUAS TT18 TaxID=3447451 RepID=UPI003F524D48
MIGVFAFLGVICPPHQHVSQVASVDFAEHTHRGIASCHSTHPDYLPTSAGTAQANTFDERLPLSVLDVPAESNDAAGQAGVRGGGHATQRRHHPPGRRLLIEISVSRS